MIRLGLCCAFRAQPINFHVTTAAACARLRRGDAMQKLADLCRSNAAALLAALEYCARHEIGCFRVNSQILPLKTHPEQGYDLADLPGGRTIREEFRRCGDFARSAGLRTSFHPDQFVVLNSPREQVLASSRAELDYQAEVAEWIGADVITIHAGGVYGDKQESLRRLARVLSRLAARVRRRLALENDDTSYAPADLLPVCCETGIPLVYDVHHHRCHPDRLSVDEATRQALQTWDREPVLHISSPLEGWNGPKPERHSDYIDLRDFPRCWDHLDATVEVEAKAKELAVDKLHKALRRRARRARSAREADSASKRG